jgi:hypothetical protein
MVTSHLLRPSKSNGSLPVGHGECDLEGDTKEAAREAGEVAGTARRQAGGVARTGTQEVRSVAREASSQARRPLTDSGEELRTQANSQSARVAEGLRQIGRQLQQMAGAVDDQSSPVVHLASRTSATAGDLADRLDCGGIDGVIDDTRRFAGNRPGLFLAGAVGTGLVFGRLLKGVSSPAGDSSGTTGRPGSGSADVAALAPRSAKATDGDGGVNADYPGPALAWGTRHRRARHPSNATGLPVEPDPMAGWSGEVAKPAVVEGLPPSE